MRIDPMTCIAVGISQELAEKIILKAKQFRSWDLYCFVSKAPSKTSIWKARRVAALNKIQVI